MTFREATEVDRQSLLALVSRMNVSFAGCAHPTVQRILCRDAARQGKVRCVLADGCGVTAGFVISITDSRRYWRQFLLRHPLAGLFMMASRLWRKAEPSSRQQQADASLRPLLETEPCSYGWGDAGPHIAKIQFIGVAPEVRGQGVGGQLYEAFFKAMEQNGINRIDAHIEPWNGASVRLHHRAGYRIFDHGKGFYAVKELTGCLPERGGMDQHL
jgi:ribosomal protein S18 acetylase RimI-like enzyme